ncbi:MAG: calcium-translocating P-type ATPase, PMCA-type [Clostridia bacterium]|nr:calcium-translocating P-type ATPase, PMCA-type [Clostridia bacterium]
MQKFYDAGAEEVLSRLKTSPLGLSQKEAAERLKKYGANTLKKEKRDGIVKLFLSQFKDVMTILLIAAAFVSAIIAFLSGDSSDLTDTFIILFIILLNAAVGAAQQFRADKAIENLKKLSVCKVKCRRGGKDILVDSENIVVGDVITLEEGDMVPADCRILSCASLRCDESALTGESAGVDKSADAIRGENVGLSSQSCMLFSSSYVLSGTASAVVTATGMDTEIGGIAGMLQGAKPAPTPLENSLNKLGKIISAFVMCVTAFIFMLGLVVKRVGVLQNFMTSVAIAVAAIPEGLPAVVTIIMAMGVQRMSKKNVVIRKLKSVETLGGCNYVCTDKTGTLTENKMRAAEVTLGVAPFKDGSAAASRMHGCMSACVNVKGERGAYIGDPTEAAVKEFAAKRGDFSCERIAEKPFTSERKMMSVAVKSAEGRFVYAKGAPDVLLKHCTHIEDEGGRRVLSEAERKSIISKAEEMSAKALRVLGFGYGIYAGRLQEDGLTFTGLCGMADGIKPGVKEAVSECVAAGITAVMITGDHKKTAFAIAKEAGIATDMSQVISGDELENLSEDGWREVVKTRTVFARVSPKHKNEIVKYLKEGGNVVAMTGDGVNDAPSIRTADIGIAMGRSGTDVTKNASDMVITDDNFTTIVSAVREGRRIFSNIKKTIKFFIATNLAEVLSILIASIVFWNCEFLRSTQLLWINLITDSFPVLALGMERADDYAMKRPPERAEKSLFSRQSMLSVLIFGVYMTAVTLGVYVFGLQKYGNAAASTMTFLTVSFLELFHAFNIRSERDPFFKGLFTNKILIGTVLAAIVVNVLLCIVTPLKNAFGLTSLTAVQWCIVCLLSLSVIFVGEIYKAILRRCDKRKLPLLRK